MSGENKNGSGNGHTNGKSTFDDHEDAENAAKAEENLKPPEPLTPPPPAVAELCAAAMRFVASKYKVALDGTPDTLSLLDQYVREAREAYQERPESIEVVAPAVGAYLGEVMRQEFRAEWFADGDYGGWRLYFTNVYLAFNPLGMGREAISMQDEPGWNAHLQLDPGEREEIEQRLAAMPEVDEEEYYLPTTRLDVVTGIVETLRARAEASGVGDVEFTPEDYES
jgi:hypothetical protein